MNRSIPALVKTTKEKKVYYHDLINKWSMVLTKLNLTPNIPKLPGNEITYRLALTEWWNARVK